MPLSERTLEEDEVKIDNLLHKILKSNEQVSVLVKQIKGHVTDGECLERIRMVDILTETIENLASLADEIDMHDETITKELETQVRGELREAIVKISRASELV